MSDGCGGYFVNSAFHGMRNAIGPAAWQAMQVPVRKNYCQLATRPVRPAPFQIHHSEELRKPSFVCVATLLSAASAGVRLFTNFSKIVTGTNVPWIASMAAGDDFIAIECPSFSTAHIRLSRTASARGTVSGATLTDATPTPSACNAPRRSGVACASALFVLLVHGCQCAPVWSGNGRSRLSSAFNRGATCLHWRKRQRVHREKWAQHLAVGLGVELAKPPQHPKQQSGWVECDPRLVRHGRPAWEGADRYDRVGANGAIEHPSAIGLQFASPIGHTPSRWRAATLPSAITCPLSA